ncbi:biotin-independent malonate decarboxylase subunit beta [Geomicrobium sp. JCM 19038]|uniref:biotin-independent malonate decarboxylase subunit beta n=1 Tax=Geomicrobium sp. JCM 19038 TaxID=1460635 RepID=UPI00045F3F5D|nr:biotin-independent malonate decarboxylase subunit beta [Geomicrobium sp. JCM 19038]GAK06860.1 malonate decarboxylase beta subunit [Geomicrobium sp. JCM 19038]
MKITVPQSLTECSARERTLALLDENSARELLGPFDRLVSPHLEKQNIVPQSDDGVVVMKGTRKAHPCCVIAIEGSFQGGGIGEVSGAKIASAFELALRDVERGKHLDVIVILDTGGVRLQEANYGLLAISEIQQAAVNLQQYVPIVGIIPGRIGSFGGMSITAGLFNALIMTKEARLGLNGPEVIEQEAGIEEVNSRDRKATYLRIGSASRKKNGLIEYLVEDSVEAIQEAVDQARLTKINQRVTSNEEHVNELLYQEVEAFTSSEDEERTNDSRGRTWLEVLSDIDSVQSSRISTVQSGTMTVSDEKFNLLAVTKDAYHRFPRVRNGEFGLLEGYALADVIDQWIAADETNDQKTPIVAVIDVVSQAYGAQEELLGLHQSCAAAVHAYARAREHGHKIIGLVVGKALSAAFLSHGLQADRLLAFDDPYVQVHVMSKKSAAKVTKRSLTELERFTKDVPAMAYDVRSFHKLGATDELIEGISVEHPTEEDVSRVQTLISNQLADLEAGGLVSEHRLNNARAKESRAASIEVRVQMEQQWANESREERGRIK